jgi:hypothetical protein
MKNELYVMNEHIENLEKIVKILGISKQGESPCFGPDHTSAIYLRQPKATLGNKKKLRKSLSFIIKSADKPVLKNDALHKQQMSAREKKSFTLY